MAKSDSLSVTVSQLAGVALSNLISLGSFGDVVFQVSPEYVRTFETLNRESGAVFADHEVAGGKPVSEMTGEELDKIDFRMVFNASLGISPIAEIEKLRKMKAEGTPQEFIVGSNSLGKFTIRTIAEEWVHTSGIGRVLVLVADVNLVEYINTLPTQAQQKTREDEIKRTETGKGGPARLPGAAEKTQTRELKPKIDEVTRMEIP